MTFTLAFLVDGGCALASRNHDRLGRRSNDQRAVVGKGTDAWQAGVRRAGHRGTDQQKGAGENEAEGLHVAISGSDYRRGPPFRCQLDNHSSFPDVCAKTGIGFVAPENCFVASA
jgi:hypothetical protein